MKIILLGSTGVGKTSLLHRYTHDHFSESVDATLGMDFEIKTVEVQGHKVTLHIWDTAGQEKFRNIVSAFYRDVNGVILVYDVTSMGSFLETESWLNDLQLGHNNRTTAGLLVGNKCDLQSRRVVDPQVAAALANRLGLAYAETSAKDSSNVSATVTALAEQLLLRQQLLQSASPTENVETTTSIRLRRPTHNGCFRRTCSFL